MRTTLNLPDGLVEEVRELGRADGRTLTSHIEEGLRVVLERARERGPEPVRLPTSGRPGGRMLVDILDREALAEALGDDEPVPGFPGPADSPARG